MYTYRIVLFASKKNCTIEEVIGVAKNQENKESMYVLFH